MKAQKNTVAEDFDTDLASLIVSGNSINKDEQSEWSNFYFQN